MISAITGKAINRREHIKQSITDILTTPIGSRVMRREYGSELFELIDQPQNSATRLRLMSATVSALTVWEPRINIITVTIEPSAINGQLVISLTTQDVESGESDNYQVNYGNSN